MAPDKYAHLGVQELVIFEPWKHQPGLRTEDEVETLRVFRLRQPKEGTPALRYPPRLPPSVASGSVRCLK